MKNAIPLQEQPPTPFASFAQNSACLEGAVFNSVYFSQTAQDRVEKYKFVEGKRHSQHREVTSSLTL